jgi:hypothetical protein
VEPISASMVWGGPDSDVLTVSVEPLRYPWSADPVDGRMGLFVLRALDGDDRETDAIAGLEIIGFLDFDRWDDLPELPGLWRLSELEPLPLRVALQRKQAELRGRVSWRKKVGPALAER